MSKIKEKIEPCESCGKLFPADKLTTDHICTDCEEYWRDYCTNQNNLVLNGTNGHVHQLFQNILSKF